MMNYDENIFQKFKALSIQKVEDLEVGKTYYSNYHGSGLTVKRIISQREFDMLKEYKDEPSTSTEPRWFLYGDGEFEYESLRDNNIGASYNPWLLFADEETMEECLKELIISYSPSSYWD